MTSKNGRFSCIKLDKRLKYSKPSLTTEMIMTRLKQSWMNISRLRRMLTQFRQAVHEKGETVDQFATRLRKLAANCEFRDKDKELKSAIIQNCLSKRLRRYALREEALTLDNLLSKARGLEASEAQATGIKKSLPHVPDAESCRYRKEDDETTATGKLKHLSELWIGMATQERSVPSERKHVSQMWKTEPLCQSLSFQAKPEREWESKQVTVATNSAQ